MPGYHHRTGQAIDVVVGTISKEGGLKIDYDMGEMNATQCPPFCGGTSDELWRKRQVINGQTMVCVYTKKKMLVVTFLESHANFYATIKSEDQMADMLLMLVTFQSVYSGL